MTLTAKDVAEITKLLEESSFDELYLEIDGVKLSLRRGGGSSQPTEGLTGAASGGAASGGAASGRAVSAGAASADSASAAVRPEAARPATAPVAPVDPSVHEVPAPLLGTFYRAPKPGASPFVEIGSTVQAETIIGIIEVMKLMNTVRAGVSGRVTEILARDGALVEYGETLMRVGTAGS